jgi:hypothetical protein
VLHIAAASAWSVGLVRLFAVVQIASSFQIATVAGVNRVAWGGWSIYFRKKAGNSTAWTLEKFDCAGFPKGDRLVAKYNRYGFPRGQAFGRRRHQNLLFLQKPPAGLLQTLL